MSINTFVFLDLETTGLPHFEYNRTKITELCLIAVQSDHIELGCYPRVLNKLSFCFNPLKLVHYQAAELTGLSNDLLENQVRFSAETVQIIRSFFEANRKPICLVAHNGFYFDFPILLAEISNTGSEFIDDLLCVDSLEAFRTIEQDLKPKSFDFNDNEDDFLSLVADELEKTLKKTEKLTVEEVQKKNETTPKKNVITINYTGLGRKRKLFQPKTERLSYKLGDVYSRLTSKNPTMQHQAEGDVQMMIHCAATFAEKFVDYANRKSKLLCDIPKMTPGKKIGT